MVFPAQWAWTDAEQLLANGAFDEAAKRYEQLREDEMLGASAALRLSLIASKGGDFRRAVMEVRDAYKRAQPDPSLLELIAKRLLSLGEKQLALSSVTRLLALRDVPVTTLAELGKMLSDTDEPEAALQLLRRAERVGLSSAALHYLIGLSEMYAGNPERARDQLEASLHLDPMFAPSHWSLVKLSRKDEQGRFRDRLLVAISRLPEGHPDLPLLLYALFHRLDEEGEVHDAWRALSRAMKARRRQVQYEPVAEERMFRLLESAHAVQDEGGQSGAIPIFIVGLPRTGTTLLDRLLGRHPEVTCAGELRDFNWALRWVANQGARPLLDERLVAALVQAPPRGVGSQYLERTQWRAGSRGFYTDKLPPNFMNVAWIAESLPQAKIIHLVRDPMDACFSNLKELFAAPYAYSYDQLEMAGHYARYRRLMDHWHERFPGRIMDVGYEELVRDPDGVLARVHAHCGLPSQIAEQEGPVRSEVIATASAMQVRQPLHQRGINAWHCYAEQLAPLQQALAAAGLR